MYQSCISKEPKNSPSQMKNPPACQPVQKREQSSASFLKPGQPDIFQHKFHKQNPDERSAAQFKRNTTGLPDKLKSGIENLSGIHIDDVKVHYNSPRPAQLQALAYTQGTDIHVAPGQEKHLPHEAWHVIQQKQGRVIPTLKIMDMNINHDAALEHEADVMGDKAVQAGNSNAAPPPAGASHATGAPIVQRKYYNPDNNKITRRPDETPAVSAAKAIDTVTKPEGGLTAHHKVPWEKLKSQIETAFTIGPVSDTFLTLEKFAETVFPIDKQKFVETRQKRIDNYTANEDIVDGWIQNVCWCPKNIFIGPVTNKRIDDPSRRTGGDRTTLDAHYEEKENESTHRRERRKSIRSDKLTSLADFNLNEQDRNEIETLENQIADYRPDEWGSYTLFGEKNYYQKLDPYISEKAPANHLFDAKLNNDQIEVRTMSDYEIKDLQYMKKHKQDRPVTVTLYPAASGITITEDAADHIKTYIFHINPEQDTKILRIEGHLQGNTRVLPLKRAF